MDDVSSAGSGMVTENGGTMVLCRSFDNLLKNYKIDNIDFLKLDSEGGEYFIITKENKKILENIKVITGEFHFDMNELIMGPDNTVIKEKNMLEMLDVLEDSFDVIYTSVDGFIINDVRSKLDYYTQFLIYATNKNLKNKIIVEYVDGCAKITSEKFDNRIQCDVTFKNLDSNNIDYESKITDIYQWSATGNIANKWEVNIVGVNNTYSVTVSKDYPIKIITF
jgi:hypothetical protein